MNDFRSVYKTVEAKMRGPAEGEPRTFIQWKGTDVCMDFNCLCGTHSHWDTDFLYSLKCPGCDQIWRLSSQIQCVQVTPEEQEQLGCLKQKTAEDYPEWDNDKSGVLAKRKELGLPPL